MGLNVPVTLASISNGVMTVDVPNNVILIGNAIALDADNNSIACDLCTVNTTLDVNDLSVNGISDMYGTVTIREGSTGLFLENDCVIEAILPAADPAVPNQLYRTVGAVQVSL